MLVQHRRKTLYVISRFAQNWSILVAQEASDTAIKSSHFYPFGVITSARTCHPPQTPSSFYPRYCAIVRELAPLQREYTLKNNNATVSSRTLLNLPSSRRDPDRAQDVCSRCHFDESRLILVVRLRSQDGNGDPLSITSEKTLLFSESKRGSTQVAMKCLIRRLSFMSIVYSRSFLRSI